MQARSRFPWLYLVLAYGLAWLFWIPLALTGRDYQSSPLLLAIMLIGVFGPGLAGIILTHRQGDKEERGAFWRRMLDLRRMRPVWYPLIVLLWPAVHFLALLLNRTLSGATPDFKLIGELAARPLGIPVVIALYFLQAGLEELGWRGYMLEKILPGWGKLRSSLVIGLFHTFWHLPLFWVVGTNQIKIGLGTGLLFFAAQAIAFSIYATWCYVANGHSTLAVTLFHTVGNLCLDGFALDPGSVRNAIYTMLMVLGALAIGAAWLDRGAARKSEQAIEPQGGLSP